MKQTLLLALFAAAILLLAAAGVYVGRTSLAPAAAAGTTTAPPQPTDARWLTRQLGLSPAQATAVEVLATDYRHQLGDQCQTHCTARTGLRDVIFHQDPDAAKARAALDTMAKAQLESELATIAHLRKIHALLTPQQQPAFEKLVLACICDNCDTGLHSCGPAENQSHEKHESCEPATKE